MVSLSAVAADILTPKQDSATGLYGYVNQNDKRKIKPAYKGATDFFAPGELSKQQYAWVKGTDGLYTLINSKGKTALDGKYFDVQEPDTLGDKTAILEVQKSENGLHQLIVIHDKKVSELPYQFTTIKFLGKTGSDETGAEQYGYYTYKPTPSMISYYLENGETSSQLTFNANTGEVTSKPLDFKVVGDSYHGYHVVVKNGEPQLFHFETGTFHPLEKIHNIWKSGENDIDGKDRTFLVDLEKGKVIGDYYSVSLPKSGLIIVKEKNQISTRSNMAAWILTAIP